MEREAGSVPGEVTGAEGGVIGQQLLSPPLPKATCFLLASLQVLSLLLTAPLCAHDFCPLSTPALLVVAHYSFGNLRISAAPAGSRCSRLQCAVTENATVRLLYLDWMPSRGHQ